MAVQPDKRPYARQLLENGTNLTERYRVGEYTLQAPAREVNPRGFEIRRDRPGFESGQSVYYTLHDGWVVWDGGARFVSRDGPVACLEWFVGRMTETSNR
jgi:hypothetical protein